MSVFHHKTGFSQTSQLLFMLQCNEHVEMNKFLCSWACTSMTTIDNQFYMIDSLSLDVSLELGVCLVVNLVIQRNIKMRKTVCSAKSD